MSVKVWRPAVRAFRAWKKTLFGELFLSAVFVASLVLLCEAVLLPLEIPAHIAVGNLAAQAEAAPSGDPWSDASHPTLAVLKLDRATFQGPFGGRQPLDRCVLRSYLDMLLKAKPRLQQLGLDLDLSDTGNPEQDRCAQDIVDLLSSRRAGGLRSTLILPVDDDERRDTKSDWRERVRTAGLAMADPRVVREFGVVRRHWVNEGRCPTLGQALADEPPPAEDGLACFDMKRDLSELDGHAHAKENNISFHRLVRGAWVPQFENRQMQPLLRQIELLRDQPQVQRVILGAHFDASDDYLTPIGPLAGVEVHAAVALNPHDRIKHHYGFGIDVLLGVLFGWVVHKAWTGYFRQRLGSHGHPPTFVGMRLAYLWPLGLLLAWLLLISLGLPALSLFLLHWRGWWINPVPMLIGMSLDAFVLGSLHLALEHAGHHIKPQPPPKMTRLQHRVLAGAAALPTLAWWLVVALAAVKLVTHKSPVDLILMLFENPHGGGE